MSENVNIPSLISIIIPAYNSGKFIETTLNNLFVQTYQNFEIIIAYDEKSTDNSLELIQKISETHPITIDIGRDASSGDARNRGFRLAKGEFVIFVDADDEIMPDYLHSLKSVYDTYPELDVVCCDRLIVSEDNCKSARKKLSNQTGTINIYDRDTAVMLKATHTLSNGPWVYLIRRKYLVENNLEWPNYSIRDDYVFTLRLMEFTDKLGHYTKPLYLFIQHRTSTTHIDFAKLSEKSYPSRHDLNELYNRLNKKAKEEWMLRESRLIASGAACSYFYDEFLEVLRKYGVSRLSIYKTNDSLMGAISAIVFNISKYAYYRGIRYMKKCN